MRSSARCGAFLLAAAALATARPLAAQTPTPAVQVFKAEQLTKETFQKLPDDALIEVKGKRRTKSDLLAESKLAVEKGLARLNAAGGGGDLAKLQQEVRLKEDAEIKQETAKVKAELAKLQGSAAPATAPSQLDALRREAIELNKRYKDASLVEKIEIEKKADVLLRKARELKK